MKLKLENGLEVDDPDSILKEQANFFKTLYLSNNDDVDNPAYDVFSKVILSLRFVRKMQICVKVASRKKNATRPSLIWKIVNPRVQMVSPQNSIKFFWKDIADDVIASINYAFDKGALLISQKRGIITLLPKKGKPSDRLNNLRPISLLNTDYKIASKALAKRLEKVFPNIIRENQTGYIKKYIYIGENIRLIKDVMAFAKLNKLPGVAIFVDFKKAFDSIEWDYLAKVLNVFNFKEDFKRWVRILYADISSCVINDGFASPFFKLNRGVRQGCPLSGLLFVFGIDLLNLAILANHNIKGIKVGIEEVKITLYADDTPYF